MCVYTFNSVEQHINPKNIGVISDTRSSSDEILNWISIGFSSKVNIYNHGVLPSGSMPIILKKFNYDLGIIISASHNPAEYNGIKLIQENGSKLDDDVEISIEKNIDSLELPNQHAEIINLSDGHLEYLNFLDDVTDIDFSHFQILIDAANGSASTVIKELFDKKNANYRIINNQPDGLNINKDCGATVPENLQKNIKKEFNKIQKELKELLKDNEALKEPMEIPETKEDEKEINKQLQKSEKNKSQDRGSQKKSQQKAAKKMHEMSQKMQQAMSDAAGEMKEAN